MDQAVIILWIILLAVTVSLLPFIISLLHRTWRASRSIERYFQEMLEAGQGIAENTDHITALNNTIDVASGMLDVAGHINGNADTIKKTLADRADKLKQI